MDEIQYYEMQEEQAIGEHIANIARTIFESYEADTMGRLQRNCYKYTDAGIAISFRLHDGCDSPYVYCGDKRAYEIESPWNAIAAIGVSSIVEGSDAEVPLTWIELGDEKYACEGGEDIALADFESLCDRVNDEACELWDEANSDNEEE